MVDAKMALCWGQFVARFSEPPSSDELFVYRGHADGTWQLESSLWRLCSDERVLAHRMLEVEAEIFEEFKSRGHQYWEVDITRGAWGRHLDAIGLIRHYGGPARCLDVTFSPFVAAFFAMEETRPTSPNPVIIELKVNPSRCLGFGPEPRLELNDEEWQRVFQPQVKLRSKSLPDYFFAVPRRLHERFSRQQGALLIPLDLRRPPHDLLKEDVIVYPLDRGDRLTYLRGLKRMNITRESLFEGPDAWAASLRLRASEFGERQSYRRVNSITSQSSGPARSRRSRPGR